MARKKTKRKHRGGLTPDKYLSEDQLKKLRRHVRDMADVARMRGSRRNVVNELIIELLVGTGLRASELCQLNIADLPVAHGKDSIWVRNGKGNVVRTVDINDKLTKRIARYVRLYRKNSKPNSPLLLSEWKGQRISYQGLYTRIKRIGERAGIGKLHPHILRHTYLTRLYNVEHDLRFVQDQAGHASPTTTAIYAKTNSKARKRQVEALDDE
jgi:site-specific recombinase XerD